MVKSNGAFSVPRTRGRHNFSSYWGSLSCCLRSFAARLASSASSFASLLASAAACLPSRAASWPAFLASSIDSRASGGRVVIFGGTGGRGGRGMMLAFFREMSPWLVEMRRSGPPFPSVPLMVFFSKPPSGILISENSLSMSPLAASSW